MCVDFWAETASPVKNGLKNAFYDFAGQQFEKSGVVLSSYFPSAMGGDMHSEDYLINMDVSAAPENLLTMGFGEISDRRFYEKYIKSGVYHYCCNVAWFPEPMVVDLKRLGDRPVPENYSDLAKPCYEGEICIIGTPAIPDPMIPLFLYEEYGEETAVSFCRNIHTFGAPVNAIRHIGKSSNKFGSIFLMPVLFANVCREKKYARIVIPQKGLYAEPFVLLSKNPDSRKSGLIREFIQSEAFKAVFAEKCFPVSDTGIAECCKKSWFLEADKIFTVLQENFVSVKFSDCCRKV